MDYAFSLHVRLNEELGLGNHQEQNIVVYPNPNNSQQLFITGLEDAPAQIEFINLTGQKVMQVNFTDSSESIEISNLEAGFYVCRILCKNQVIVRNFIKL